jgi:hypothetical protein
MKENKHVPCDWMFDCFKTRCEKCPYHKDKKKVTWKEFLKMEEKRCKPIKED